MKLQRGERVKVLDETTKGTVTEINENGEVKVLIDDGFEYFYSPSQLISEEKDRAIESLYEQSLPSLQSQYEESNEHYGNVTKQKSKKKKDDILIEVDLHIEELIDRPGKLTNTDALNMQLSHCRRELNKAIRKGYHKMVLIHGVGEGVLKQAVRELLDEYDCLQYSDAPFNKYGYGGGTQVTIYQSMI